MVWRAHKSETYSIHVFSCTVQSDVQIKSYPPEEHENYYQTTNFLPGDSHIVSISHSGNYGDSFKLEDIVIGVVY
jgi:hypothetical protein